ncbi:MAG: 50S ribosomal protein L25 [Candidatus Saccharimonadales bacterium]
MQDKISLSVKLREDTGKAVADLRSQGMVPGVVYGQGKDAKPVLADGPSLRDVYMQAGTNRLIEVSLEGSKKPLSTLFVDVQHHPVTGDIIHFDLYTVKMDEAIETEIPIHFEGTSPATYNLGGILVTNLETIEVRALPDKLPKSFEVSLEGLEEINDSIHVSDLKVPEGVELLDELEELIVKIDPPRSEEELEELDEEIDEDAEKAVASEHGTEDDEGDEEEGKDSDSEESVEDTDSKSDPDSDN